MLLAILLGLAAGSAETAFGQPAANSIAAAAKAPQAGGAAACGFAAAGDAAAAVVVPVPSEKAVQYYRSGNVLWVVSQLVALAIPAIVLLGGLSAKLQQLARRIGRRWFFIIGVYFILYAVLEYILALPLAFYAGYVRPHAYGLSNLTLQKWWGDSLKWLAVGMVFGGLLLWIPYLLIRSSPRRWWLYTGLCSLPVMFCVMLVEPIWVAPLFNRFGPMQDERLEARILALAQRAGIDGGHVFEVDKSADTTLLNAYVTGLLGTKRIVLWDTLLAKLDADQVLFVMGHEMGHYVLDHVFLGILAGFAGILVGLYLVYRLSGGLLRRFKDRFGFEQLSDVASLPLILLLLHLVSLLLMPAGLAVSRHLEHEADRFGLELTRDNHAAATAFVRLQSENLGNPRPGPLFILWRADHPPLAKRIEFANSYHPWTEGKPGRYDRLFRAPSPEAPQAL
jgi:Zn-dependent protease with chaperone function